MTMIEFSTFSTICDNKKGEQNIGCCDFIRSDADPVIVNPDPQFWYSSNNVMLFFKG